MKHFLLFIVILLSFWGGAQSMLFRFDGRITNTDHGRNEGGVKVAIVQNGSELHSVASSSNGKYVLKGEINYNTPFDVVFSKPGLITKKVAFNFKGLNEEDTPAGAEYEPISDLSIDLFEDRENIDFSFLENEPVASFDWDAKKFAADLDRGQVAKMKRKIDELLQEAENKEAETEAKYNEAITAADAAFGEENYEGALAKYEEALSYKPKEQYPANKILELDALIQAQKEEELKEQHDNEEYYNLIEAADDLRDAGDLDNAEAKYKEALTIKEEQYPKDEIEIIKALRVEQENQEAYDSAIEAADMLFDQKSYKASRDKYQEALDLKPSEQYPKTKLAEIEQKLKKQEEEEQEKQKYEDAVAQADQLYDAENWEESKTKYEEALSYERAATYPASRIELIEKKLAELNEKKELEEKINNLLAEGEANFTAKKYEAALTNYESVKELDASNAAANSRIEEINTILEEQAENQELESQFTQLVKEGDNFITNTEFATAVEKYEEALALKEDVAVQEKLNSAKKKLEEQQQAEENEAKFNALVQEGDAFVNQTNYEDAVSKYSEALELKQNNAVTAKLNAAQEKLNEQKNQEELEEEFASLIDEADQLFDAEEYASAKEKYAAANAVKKDAYPKSKIDEIDRILEEMQSKQEQEAKFEALKNEGFDLASREEYASAKSTLNNALRIKEDTEITAKIEEIDAILAAQKEQASLGENYNRAIEEADQSFSEKNYNRAIEKYEEALSYKNEEYPSSKIAEIKRLQEKLSEQEKLDEEYNTLLDNGDALVSEKKYVEAIKMYNEALALKPGEQVPVDKAKRAQMLADEQNQSEGDEQYEKILATAEEKIQIDEFNQAKELLNRAISLRPDDDRAPSMLEKIQRTEKNREHYNELMQEGESLGNAKEYDDAIRKYEEAKVLIPEKTMPDDRIAELRKERAAYNQSLEEDELFYDYLGKAVKFEKLTKLEKAIINYQNALNIKGDYQPAIDKIEELQNILDQRQNEREENVTLRSKFDALVKEGDKYFFVKQEYQESIGKYKDALEIFPENKYVQKQIIEAERFSESKAKEEIEIEYQKILRVADEKFEEENYERAVELYNRAITFKESDPYPKRKLQEIDAILNPVTEVGPILEPLGEPFDNSLMDGTTALQQAEAKRKAMKSQSMENHLMNIAISENEASRNKQQEHLETSNDIYQLYRNMDLEAKEVNLNKQAVIEALRNAENEIAMENRENTSYETADNYRTNEKIDAIQKENAIDYQEDISVYMNNHEDVEKIRIEAEKISNDSKRAYYAKNIESDQTLTVIMSDIEDYNIANTKDRLEAGRNIEKIRDAANEELNKGKKQAYAKNVSDEEKLAAFYVEHDKQQAEGGTKASENKERLKKVEQAIAEKEYNDAIAKQGKSLEAKEKINKIEEDLSEENRNRNNAIAENIEAIQNEAERIEDKYAQDATDENTKYLNNKAKIEHQEEISRTNDAIARERQNQNQQRVEEIQAKTNNTYEDATIKDKSDRLNTKNKVENITDLVASNASASTEKQDANKEKVDNLYEIARNEESSTAKSKKKAIYDTKKKMDKIDGTGPEKTIAKNVLGEEFPEGVSQEIFQKKDDYGLISAVITRRIVVVEGRGNVYVKTESVHGTTYKKNGAPITEHIWQKETQAASLERHY